MIDWTQKKDTDGAYAVRVLSCIEWYGSWMVNLQSLFHI